MNLRKILESILIKDGDVVIFKNRDNYPVKASSGEKLQANVTEVDGDSIAIDNVQYLAHDGVKMSPDAILRAKKHYVPGSRKLNHGEFYIKRSDIVSVMSMSD